MIACLLKILSSLCTFTLVLTFAIPLTQAPATKLGPEQTADVDKALRAYEERADRNLDRTRQELEQMKKELHDLLDMRLSMATALAELRARSSGAAGALGASNGHSGSAYQARGGGGQGSSGGDPTALARELEQVHNQLRNEIDQQQNQVAQLASQLRAMKEQGSQAGSAAKSAQGHQDQGKGGHQGGTHYFEEKPPRKKKQDR